MHLKYCSLTGADDAVKINDLSALAADFPFLETALLLMPERAGQPRCPSYDWIKNFAAQYKGVHKAMHLCGSALLRFVDNDEEILGLMRGFSRIQLNLTFEGAGEKITPAQLSKQALRHDGFEFIIQYGPQHQKFLPAFGDVPNHALLFDDSAGRGVSPDSWPAPLPGHFCGYAGGLNPDNIDRHLDLINDVAGDATVWIDMETGVRTNDRYDLVKCRRVLEIASEYA